MKNANSEVKQKALTIINRQIRALQRQLASLNREKLILIQETTNTITEQKQVYLTGRY